MFSPDAYANQHHSRHVSGHVVYNYSFMPVVKESLLFSLTHLSCLAVCQMGEGERQPWLAWRLSKYFACQSNLTRLNNN